MRRPTETDHVRHFDLLPRVSDRLKIEARHGQTADKTRTTGQLSAANPVEGARAVKRLVANYWYKAIVVLSAPPFLLALTLPLNMNNRSIAMIAAGIFLFGVGEWINHPPRPAYAFDHPTSNATRVASMGGLLMDLLGLYLLTWGIVMLLHSWS
jgi:hypothetical protein